MDSISEWKSVSDNTVNLLNRISNEIIKQSKSSTKKISNIKSIPYKSGDFMFDVEGLLGDIDKIRVYYTIYFCDDERDYEYLTNGGNLYCSADYEDKYIVITTAYVGDNIQSDLIDDVNHEVNHLLQYANGASKNEDLYGKVVALCNDRNMSIIERSPALLMYYTFKHEEDSFAVQFYSFLKRFDTEPNVIMDFEEAINGFQIHKNVMNCYKMSNENINEDEVITTIYLMGLSIKQWKLRTEKGIRRLRRKLHHAYERHVFEKNGRMKFESLIKRDFNLFERYGDMVYDFEPMYDFKI